MTTIEEMEELFDDHPSLDVSLRDFEPGSSEIEQSPRFGNLYPSHHSGFRSESSDSDMEESIQSGGGYSPPAWRRARDGSRSSGFWERNNNVFKKHSASPSPYASDDEEDETLAVAARTKLPTGSLSPEKRGSMSPFPTGGSAMSMHGIKEESAEPEKDSSKPKEESPEKKVSAPSTPVNEGYIRFAVKAEVQHRTEPYEAAFEWCKNKFTLMTKSWTASLLSVIAIFLMTSAMQAVVTPGIPVAVPDLVKVAGLARAFEPLIYYSENGVTQIGDLQATGVAVWDLGESVRSTNMTSAPIIVRELDDLSESLKTLSIELTKFFANVDGDVDGILIVMDWAKRELSQLSSSPSSHLTSAFTNLHGLLSNIGVLEKEGHPTKLGLMATTLFGQTLEQRTRRTLQRTFTEFLSVLEESINNELIYSQALFALFESIDRQFLNLARTVIRESDQQERLESDMLASLWTRLLGGNSRDLRKYEKNKALLSNVRQKTVTNKRVLIDHNSKLQTLKANLEMLRKKLVSPLVRSDNSSTLSVEEQIRGLDSTYEHLSGVRERQKGKLMEMLYGAGRRRIAIEREEVYEIEGRR